MVNSEDRFPLTDELIESIYGFAFRRLNTTHDAQDLAQEICAEALTAWERGARPSSAHAWLWGLARNRWRKWLERRHRERCGAPDLLGGLVPPGGTDAAACDGPGERLLRSEERRELNLAISRLSESYREMIVLHYLQGRAVGEIAARLAVPEGTVKRRLHGARTRIRKGLESMAGESMRSYAPANLELWGGYGLARYHDRLARALTRNILAVAYDAPLSVEQLAQELGVSAVYIEEEVAALAKDRFLKRNGSGHYATDFVILGAGKKAEFDFRVADAWEGLGARLVQAVERSKPAILAHDFYGRALPWPYLMWTLLVFACDQFFYMACEKHKSRWGDVALQEYGKDYRVAGTVHAPEARPRDEFASPRMLPWSNLHQYFGNVCGYRGVQYGNLYEATPFPDRDSLVDSTSVGVLVCLADGRGHELSASQLETAALLLASGLVTNEGGVLTSALPTFRAPVLSAVGEIIREAVRGCVDDATDRVCELADSLLLPMVRRDLKEEYANWIVPSCLYPMSYVLHQCKTEGLLQWPDDYSRAAHALYLRLDP